MKVIRRRELFGDEYQIVSLAIKSVDATARSRSLHCEEAIYDVAGKNYSVMTSLDSDDVTICEITQILLPDGSVLSANDISRLKAYEAEGRYIEAPNSFNKKIEDDVIFLAGGISGCGDWQAAAALAILDSTAFTVVNPRRSNYDMTDPLQSKVQIMWEHRFLDRADKLLFWFPKTSLCPITLLEYGKWMCKKAMVVGCEPGYARQLDIEIQTELEHGKPIEIYTTVQKLVEAVINEKFWQ